MKLIRVYFLALTLLFFVDSQSAFAGGLYLREFGQPSQAAAGAGAGALAQDASIAFENPSGVFNLDSDSQWMVTGILLDSKVEFDPDGNTTVPGSDGGDAGGTAGGGAVFHARKLTEDVGLTFALNSISGSALDYSSDFVGRYTGTDVDLLTVTFTPSVAYKVAETFAVSAGVPMTYGQLDLDAAVPPLTGPANPSRDGRVEVEDGDDFVPTVAATATWQATPELRFALGYIYETELDFDSDTSITLPGPGSGTGINNVATDVEMVLPQVIRASFIYEFCDNFALLGRFAWEDWSTLDAVPVSTNVGGAAIPLDWEDVYGGSIGFRWRPDDKWTVYSGIGYESDPTSSGDRLSVLPADEQIRLAGGFTYDISNTQTFGMALTYMDLGAAPMDRTSGGGRVSGEFDENRLFVLGVNYGWG